MISHARMNDIENYARMDKSDPFARARMITHTKNGIASLLPKGREAFYKATPNTVQRTFTSIDGTVKTYDAVEYTSVQRP